MNAQFIPIHFRIINGTHWLLLCNPSVLATERNSTLLRSATTCPQCYIALTDPSDEAEVNREVHKRMNNLGKPRK